MHLCKCFLCYFLAWEQLKAYAMLCYDFEMEEQQQLRMHNLPC